MKYNKLCDLIGYRFKDENLLSKAFTHPSRIRRNEVNHYERLEFLGDRVLGLAIAEYLLKHFNRDTEGQLTKFQAHLVSRHTCEKIGKSINLLDYLNFAKNDFTKRSSITADALEAMIAAIFLDSSYETVKDIIYKLWQKEFESLLQTKTDPKSQLQEWSQANGFGLPNYELISRSGSDHEPEFTVAVRLGDRVAEGKGFTKKEAEQEAAKNLLEKLSK